MIRSTIFDLNAIQLLIIFLSSLVQINVAEVVMLSMTSLQKYVLSETNKVSVKLFNKITRITEVKTWVKHVLR